MIEGLISAISPEWALKRETARKKLELSSSFSFGNSGAYTGATTKRSLRGWSVHKGSPDSENLGDLETLRDRSRDLYRNNPIGRGAIKNQITNVVGAGLKLQPRIDRVFLGLTDEQADKWESDAEREFLIWAESNNCDASKRCDFYELQELTLKTVLQSGESFNLLPLKKEKDFPYDLRIQIIEGDRIETPPDKTNDPKTLAGIETDDWGAPSAYYIANKHPNDIFNYNTPLEFKRVIPKGSSGKVNLIHLYQQERPGQRRGTPYLSPVIDVLKNLTRYSESVLQRAIIQSYLTIFIKTETGEMPDTPFLETDQKLTEEEKTVNYELGPGAVMPLLPGESIETVNPGGPDSKFDEFYMMNLKLIGMSLEIPLEVLVKNFQASYSAARASFLDFWRTIKTRRAWLARKFCQPIYEEWLAEAILKGRLSAPGYFDDLKFRKAWSRAQWNGPSPGQIDPTKEVEAYILQRDNGFITHQDAAAQINGSDFESNVRALKTENALKKDAGLIVPLQTGLSTAQIEQAGNNENQ